MGKSKITWKEGVKEKFEQGMQEYFSKLDEDILKKCFNIMLHDNSKNT